MKYSQERRPSFYYKIVGNKTKLGSVRLTTKSLNSCQQRKRLYERNIDTRYEFLVMDRLCLSQCSMYMSSSSTPHHQHTSLNGSITCTPLSSVVRTRLSCLAQPSGRQVIVVHSSLYVLLGPHHTFAVRTTSEVG